MFAGSSGRTCYTFPAMTWQEVTTGSGARIAATVSRQLRLDEPAARRRFRYASTSPWSVSQKRNLGDRTIHFAGLVGDLENWRPHLLTADSMERKRKLWMTFRDSLLPRCTTAPGTPEGQPGGEAERARPGKKSPDWRQPASRLTN
jgi:hypothetical protein